MLYTDRKQAIGVEFESVSVPIKRPDAYFLGPGHFLKDARYAQAALFAFDLAGGRDDFRIDQHQQLVFRLGNIQHNHLLVDIDLRRCEAYSRRGVHGLGHVIDQRTRRFIDLLDRFRNRVQARIRVFEYLDNITYFALNSASNSLN